MKISTNEKIKVKEIDIQIKRKNINSMSIIVAPPSGEVSISAPTKTPTETVRLFVLGNLKKIRLHISDFQKQERISNRNFVSGESVYVQGIRCLLDVIETPLNPFIKMRGKKIVEMNINPGMNQKQREKLFERWMKEILKKDAKILFAKWSEILCVELNSWNIRKMKTKWATTRIDRKTMTLNPELAKKNGHKLESVIVSQMIKILKPDNINDCMDIYIPRWRHHKRNLNQSVLPE